MKKQEMIALLKKIQKIEDVQKIIEEIETSKKSILKNAIEIEKKDIERYLQTGIILMHGNKIYCLPFYIGNRELKIYYRRIENE